MTLWQRIKNILADEDILDEKGRVILEKLKPLMYDEEGFSYRTLGESFTDSFKNGYEFKKSIGR